jgi:hypothetical protein
MNARIIRIPAMTPWPPAPIPLVPIPVPVKLAIRVTGEHVKVR